ncbi:hypothetical protein ACTXT7_007214 [Hymenolepis weldensis]
MAYHLSNEGSKSPLDNYPTNTRGSHQQDADFAENIVIIETALLKNCNKNSHKEGLCQESSSNSSTRQNPNNKRALTGQSYGTLMQVNVNSRKYVNLSINGTPFELLIDTDSDI